MMETGLSLKQDSKTGRDSQSSVFFKTPEMPWLYSGVEIRTPSQDEIKRLSAFTARTTFVVSRSSLYKGMSSSVTTGSWIAGADSLARTLKIFVLKDALRKLPEIPTMLTGSITSFLMMTDTSLLVAKQLVRTIVGCLYSHVKRNILISVILR